MRNLFFYQTLNDKLLEEAGCSCSEYGFSYHIEGVLHSLQAKGKSVLKLEDSLESWKIERDGLKITRQVTIQYPDILKGNGGVACRGAELGLCIIWNNHELTQMGYIMPQKVIHVGNCIKYNFEYDFKPGEIKGDLTLDTVLYLKTPSDIVREDEGHLINEAGVTLGSVDTITLNFSSKYMEFPIKEVSDSNQPLWWLELNNWEDPRSDTFDEDFICLYLNSYYECCPKVGDKIKNLEILIEIISTAYLMIFKKIDEMGYLNDTLNDNDNVEVGSISKVIFYFYNSCNIPLKTESIDSLHKTIHQNIELMLKGNDEQ